MRNYGVRSEDIDQEVNDIGLVPREVWELYRKNPVKHGLTESVFFNKSNFRVVQNDPEV